MGRFWLLQQDYDSYIINALENETPIVRKINSKKITRSIQYRYCKSNKNHIYIGRQMPGIDGSPWGNPFVDKRGNVVKYHKYLLKMDSNKRRKLLKPLFGKILYCWCVNDDCCNITLRQVKTMKCHGLILAQFCARSILSKYNVNYESN